MFFSEFVFVFKIFFKIIFVQNDQVNNNANQLNANQLYANIQFPQQFGRIVQIVDDEDGLLHHMDILNQLEVTFNVLTSVFSLAKIIFLINCAEIILIF